MFEDDPGTAERYRNALIRAGLEVAWYPFPPDSLITVVEAEHPNLLSLDITMPHMDGLAAARLLKSDARTKTIPLAFLTNLSLKEYQNEAEQLGALAFCVKQESPPETVARLYATLCSTP